MTATVEKADSVFLDLDKYNIVPLKAEFERHVNDLDVALAGGVVAFPDRTRHGFYDVKVGDEWFYVYVRSGSRTVYLVAPLQARRLETQRQQRDLCSSARSLADDRNPALAPCCH